MLVGKSQVSMCKHEKLRMNIFFSTLRVILKVGMSDYLFFAIFFGPKYCRTQILLQYQNTFTYNFRFDFRNDTIVCNKNILELYVFWLILTRSICSSSTVVVLVV